MTRTLWTWAAYVAVATVATTTHATNAVAQPPMLVCGINCMLCGPEEWGRPRVAGIPPRWVRDLLHGRERLRGELRQYRAR